MTVKRVLVVDDSELFVEVLCDVFRSPVGLTVVGVARDGAEAVRMTQDLKPDIVTMDVMMPVMNGLSAVEEIMATCPTPILVLSSDPRGRAEELSFEALKRGALDVIAKPERWPLPDAERDALVARVRFLGGVPVIRHVQARRDRWRKPVTPRASVRAGTGRVDVVGIVSSTGGPSALSTVLGGLGAEFPVPVVIVQHLAAGFSAGLCTWLDRVSPLRVREAQHGERLEAGTVYIAPPGIHLSVDRAQRVSLCDAPAVAGHRPSGTFMLRSLARAYGPQAAGVVLTGMGADGSEGLAELRAAGGPTIAQDAATSVVDGMPGAARRLGAAGCVAPLPEIAAAIRELVDHGRPR
jgi:two-component system chemotaxis response regulator CheB